MHQLELYRQCEANESGDGFVGKYLPLVRKIAWYFLKRLPAGIDIQDLVQSGMVGLIEAKNSFQPDKGATFETFAGIRIKGSIIDGLRKNSWYSREASAWSRRISETVRMLEQMLCRPPEINEIIEKLGISHEKYQEISSMISWTESILNCEVEHFENDDNETPAYEVEKSLMVNTLKSILDTLPQRDQQLLSLYYIEDFNFRQIGEIFGLTEARVCQIHKSILGNLRKLMDPGALP